MVLEFSGPFFILYYSSLPAATLIQLGQGYLNGHFRWHIVGHSCSARWQTAEREKSNSQRMGSGGVCSYL